mmetsp:Transcript_36030/g.82036  ORF Transcript_36030/g.82036 Transcript_36030/m.82036 type:complete len:205 (+) Transcript_36030:611-1225(+)
MPVAVRDDLVIFAAPPTKLSSTLACHVCTPAISLHMTPASRTLGGMTFGPQVGEEGRAQALAATGAFLSPMCGTVNKTELLPAFRTSQIRMLKGAWHDVVALWTLPVIGVAAENLESLEPCERSVVSVCAHLFLSVGMVAVTVKRALREDGFGDLDAEVLHRTGCTDHMASRAGGVLQRPLKTNAAHLWSRSGNGFVMVRFPWD